MKKIIGTIFLMTSFLSYGKIILDSSNIKPTINEPFNISVKFINEDRKDYKIEGIENLQILSKGSQSKYSYVNGTKNSEKIDNYTVIANEIKNFPLSVVISGKNKKTNTLNIEVQQERQESTSEDMKMAISVKDGDSFYFGEKIIYEESFLTTVNLNSVGYNNPPSFNDFSEKDMSSINQIGSYEQSYFRSRSGKQGLKIDIYRGILQPNSSGEKIIKSGQIAVTQSTGRRDFFFEESTLPKYFGGKNIKINILPLPSNKPIGFQNVVGKPKIDYSWSSDSVNFGQSIVLNVKISGEVNLDSLEKIITQNFKEFNVFESLKESKEDIIGGKYYGEKNFEIALIPKKNEELNTPEINIPYFDTDMKAYKFLVIPSKKIKVEGDGALLNTNPTTLSTNQIDNSTVENIKKDLPIEEIKIDNITVEKDHLINKILNNYMIIGLILVVVIEGGVIIYLLNKKGKKSSFHELEELKNSKDDKEFYEAYCNFMKKRYNFSPKVYLEDRLVKLGLSPEFIEINRELENAYYNNISIDRKNIINRIKKELKIEK